MFVRAFGLATALSVSAQAFAAPCPAAPVPAGFNLLPGAEVFGLEGPISALDPVARTVVVAGTCVNIPVGQLVDNDGDGVGDIPFSSLVSPSGRPPETGLMIIDGDVTIDASGNLVFTSTLPYFEFGEHVIVAPLVSVDAAAGTFQVGHTTVVMNSDARLPSNLIDLGGDPIVVDELVGWEGTVVGAEGYMQDGRLNATIVETEVIPANPGVDSIAIERAQHRTSKGTVDIRGQVTSQQGTGAFAASVNIDVLCNGTIDNVATVTVDPVLNLGDWRWTSGNNAFNGITTASTVCVSSALGGTAQNNFTVRN
jgi:hypothetical protein